PPFLSRMTPWEALGLRKMRRKSVTTYTERSGERLVRRDLVKLFRPAGRCVVRDRRSRQTHIVEATRPRGHEDGTVFETPLRLTAAGRDPKLTDMQQSPACRAHKFVRRIDSTFGTSRMPLR